MTEQDAIDIIERMKLARPTCAGCETMSYAWCRHLMTLGMNEGETLSEFAHARGFDELTGAAGFLKRCEACQTARLFPWAAQLDPARVRHMIETDPRCRYAFELELLKETLSWNYGGTWGAYEGDSSPLLCKFGCRVEHRSAYQFPETCRVETGQVSDLPELKETLQTELGLRMQAQQIEDDALKAAVEKYQEAVGNELIRLFEEDLPELNKKPEAAMECVRTGKGFEFL
jgi:hypothetical protein